MVREPSSQQRDRPADVVPGGIDAVVTGRLGLLRSQHAVTVMNLLSLVAAFGAMVWIFQDGHFHGFGTTSTGHLNAAFQPFTFCIAFGLSMDYEVFVLSSVREEWMKTNRGVGDNETAVALGLARTGRIVTAAATVMAIVFVSMVASQVQHMRMLGTGLAITVLVDAFLVRTILISAFMRLMGRANWWAPARLARWRAKWGLSEEHRKSATPFGRRRPRLSEEVLP